MEIHQEIFKLIEDDSLNETSREEGGSGVTCLFEIDLRYKNIVLKIEVIFLFQDG